MLKKSDYHFDLPEDLIAQYPIENRTESRLLVLDKETGNIENKIFSDILNELNEGDCLVINNTKVIPARLIGKKFGTGAKIEVMLVRQINSTRWEALIKPGKKAPEGTKIQIANCVISIGESAGNSGTRYVDFDYNGNVFEFIEENGKEPLPPYIKRETEKLDKTRYQTVFAEKKGAVAAPTAGLHFTDELLKRIKAKGVKIAPVTLHVSLGTFRPVKVDNIKEHEMHSEHYEISQESADLINETKQGKHGRVICVGTTSMRTLESSTDENGFLIAKNDSTNIFIYPGYTFKMVDALITNFHTSESTLLMLVSAFASYNKIKNAYQHAINSKYRFFSYGDSMFIR